MLSSSKQLNECRLYDYQQYRPHKGQGKGSESLSIIRSKQLKSLVPMIVAGCIAGLLHVRRKLAMGHMMLLFLFMVILNKF